MAKESMGMEERRKHTQQQVLRMQAKLHLMQASNKKLE
jgi:hypothetical protein